MKKLTILGIMVLALAFAFPAYADVLVRVTVDKDKIKTVTEDIYILKDVTINVDVISSAAGVAEAEALANVRNVDNHVELLRILTITTITDSVNDNRGIVGVNQDTGNMNNQGTAVSVALDGGGLGDGFANSQASADIFTALNSVVGRFVTNPSLIERSINDNVGIVNVNQSSGNMVSQTNAVALAVSRRSGVAMSEADLGQISMLNRVNENNTTHTALITGSVLGNRGIVGVNQSAGNMTNQSNVVSVAIATSR